MPFAENHADFLTALYSRQYHPRALENRYYKRFSLIRSFSDAHVAGKTKWRQLAAKIKEFRFIDRLKVRSTVFQSTGLFQFSMVFSK
ncbi:MAG: hypothetical protein IJT66_06815 [Clostridia bacterium]|nr:hypothetical protein [Clostridia bacterium]